MRPPEAGEFRLPFLKIPNGYPDDDKDRTLLRAKNEPSEEVLREFFTSEVMTQRLFYCPSINRDLTDDWGIFGYEPGFIFLCGSRYEGAKTIADENFLRRTNMITAGSELSETDRALLEAFGGVPNWARLISPRGVSIGFIDHYDFFSRTKLITQEITPSRTPRTFEYLDDIIKPPHPQVL